MIGEVLRNRRLATAIVVLFAGLLLSSSRSVAYSEHVLSQFAGSPDGAYPVGDLVRGKHVFYGTTPQGGAFNAGVVFKIKQKGKRSVLYSFCASPSCTDGAEPVAGLAIGKDGTLYGVTEYGGSGQDCPEGPFSGCGVIFKVSPDGKETVLYNFCSQDDCTDGSFPVAGLTIDKSGNLFGVTQYGGCCFSSCISFCGTIFEYDTHGKETVLYQFRGAAAGDGAYPFGRLLRDKSGNLFGTTLYGGLPNSGTVFKLDPSGNETVLYSFCSQTYPCPDGASPYGGLILDAAGNLYGTTFYGGANCQTGSQPGCGTVFEIDAAGQHTVLYSFCASVSCADGRYPNSGLVMDKSGSLYGTTTYGGSVGAGTVFKLDAKGRETVPYSFCQSSGCGDGAFPVAGLVLEKSGKLFGTAEYGGAANGCPPVSEGCGVVFELTP